MDRQVRRFLDSLLAVTSDSELRETWFAGDDGITFLQSTMTGNVPVYISGPRLYLYAVLVPAERLVDDYGEDLANWNFGPSSGWGYAYGMGNEDRPELCPPLDHTDTRTLEGAEPLVYLRHFEGHTGEKPYVELNQTFAQVAQVHFVPDRNTYCRLDRNGEIVDDVAITRYRDWRICTVQGDLLDLYRFVTDKVLVRVFEIERVEGPIVPINGSPELVVMRGARDEIYARRVRQDGAGAYLRGAQVIRLTPDRARLWKIARDEPIEERAYASFTIYDWRHGEVKEWSCAPAQLANYFVESDLPFETSPAFFRADVLAKYKQDPDRYSLTDGSISCRGSWHLQRYGINEAGQVFTYVVDLGRLPYDEQLYWKSHNEPPKAGLPEATVARDFRGEWVADENPLADLRRLLTTYPTATQGGELRRIWALPDGEEEKQLNRMHYVVTTSSKEWSDEILQLAKVVIEGLQMSPLRALADHLGCYDPKLGTIKLLDRCLLAKGIDPNVAEVVREPLQSLWAVRSGGIAHLGAIQPKKGRDFKDDYRRRVLDAYRAMDRLAELIRGGLLDIP